MARINLGCQNKNPSAKEGFLFISLILAPDQYLGWQLPNILILPKVSFLCWRPDYSPKPQKLF